MGGHNLRLGRVGEEQAAEWYRSQGYALAARNWRCREGEIDLIARRGRTWVFVEVKARSTSAFGEPIEAVTPAKAARIRRLAARWLREESGGAAGVVRFDVAAVLDGSVEVVEAAF